VPSVVERNAAKYALLQRSDTALRNTSLADKLQRRGMTLNVADTAGFRDRVGDLYKRWKDEFGDTARGLLESHCGKLA
jgi:TRAP-type C4-dicarboxylate transport system substrate-binding protein